MPNDSSGLAKTILAILLFPTFFQEDFIHYSSGTDDVFWIACFKRLFLLLPTLAIILGCWVSIGALLSVIVRQDRQEFITALFVTWWDLGKAIAVFWGGLFKFVFTLLTATLVFLRILIFTLWSIAQDLLLIPFSMLRSFTQKVTRSNVPWLAVFMTLLWGIIETSIFTYVTTPLVIDTFSNITGEQLTKGVTQIILFIFLFIVVLGSYAVISNLVEAFKHKKIVTIAGIFLIEIIVMAVEVMFLYRELVDTLVPWMAQYSENFDLSAAGVITISALTWFGIRSLSWFLFAGHGTPTLLAIIQGKGVIPEKPVESPSPPPASSPYIEFTASFIQQIKKESEWITHTGEALLADFILPPLQVVAAAINFCILLITANHLFEIPLKNMDVFKNSRELLGKIFHTQQETTEKPIKPSKKKAIYHDV